MSYIDNRLLSLIFASQLGGDRWPRNEQEVARFVNDLIHTDWEADDGAIRLRRDLTLEQVAGSLFFDQMRIFLRTLAGDEGAGLTATGNLNRIAIARLLGQMSWPRAEVEDYCRIFGRKSRTETDIRRLNIVRIISDCGNLTLKRRNRLLVSRKAISLTQDPGSGTLFRHLFVTFFRRFNLNYLSGFPETPLVQDFVPVMLWRLSLTANDWIDVDKLRGQVLHPVVRAQILSVSQWEHAEAVILVRRVLQPLCWLGLLDTDTPDNDHMRAFELCRFRKTPLFDQFLSFHFTR